MPGMCAANRRPTSEGFKIGMASGMFYLCGKFIYPLRHYNIRGGVEYADTYNSSYYFTSTKSCFAGVSWRVAFVW